MFALLFFIHCLVSQTVVPLPPERPGTLVCDDAANFVIQLMRDESAIHGQAFKCTVYGQFLNEQTEIPWETQCDCFEALDDFSVVYTKECRLTEYSNFWVSEAAMYCNQDINLIGPTDVRSVDKSTDTFDLSTWEGVSGTSIGQGQMLRKTFTVDDQGINAVYAAVRFKSLSSGTWDPTDKLVVRIMTDVGGTQQWNEQAIYSSALTADTTEDHMVVFSLNPVDFGRRRLAEHTFTVGFTMETGGDDQTYWIEMVDLGVYSRDETALLCRGDQENIGTSFYPVFNQQQSGFMAPNTGNIGDSQKLTFVLEVPRYYYDITIDFQGGNGFAGFSESRAYSDDVDTLDLTYWRFGGETIDDNPCGYEQVIAEIPWTVFNEEGGGNLELLTEWNDGLGNIDNDDTFYKFGGTIELTANEHVYLEETEVNTGANREWRTQREQVWRVPFVIRQQRIVLVATTFDVNPPDLLIDFVGALTMYVQAETVYDLETRDNRAFVTMSITTKTRYPYMLIPGLNEDDPPAYFEDMTPPLDNSGNGWWPPQVDYSTTHYDGINVFANFSWVSEDRPGCTFISSVDISDNDDRECHQNWKLQVIPLDGACYIDGLYQIEFGARCFYEKPTCLFNTDPTTGEVANSVMMTLDVESTNMCPELVMDVDIYGELCDTGRLGWMRCHEFVQNYPCGNDASACIGPGPAVPDSIPINAYFQNDHSYFFAEIFSNDGKIIYSSITDIWVTDESEPNLFSVPLYQDNAPLDLSWFNPNLGVDEAVPAVILDVQDSNYFAPLYPEQGTQDTDYGNFAGFHVLLDERIFPAPVDRAVDWTFTVRVEVLYEGWGNEKRRRLIEIGLPLKGGERVTLQQPIEIGQHKRTIQDCPVREDMRWVLTLTQQFERMELIQSLQTLLQSADFGIDSIVQEELSQTLIVNTRSGETWTTLLEVMEQNSEEFQNSPFGNLRHVSCLDIPENKNPTNADIMNCANGEMCSFYEGQTLDEYLTPVQVQQIDVNSGVAGLNFFILFLSLFAWLF